jgi:hypothetical protein
MRFAVFHGGDLKFSSRSSPGGGITAIQNRELNSQTLWRGKRSVRCRRELR